MRRAAMTHVLLGLISLRPLAGYELARYDERSVDNCFTLTRGREGYLSAVRQRQ
jgi:hypothetical protein